MRYTRSVVYEKGELVKEFDESAAGLWLLVSVPAACVNAGANQFGVSWTETRGAGPSTPREVPAPTPIPPCNVRINHLRRHPPRNG